MEAAMQQATGVRPFSFERVFSETKDAESQGGGDLHMRLAALESENARLRREADDVGKEIARARAEGFDVGQAEEKARRDEDLRQLTRSLVEQIERIDRAVDEAAERLGGRAAAVARTAAEIIAGRALVDDPTRTIDDAIGRALKEAARGEELHIHVHPDLAPDIETCVQDRQDRERRRLRLVVVPDADLGPHDSRISWAQGEIVLSRETRAAAVRLEFEKLFGEGD